MLIAGLACIMSLRAAGVTTALDRYLWEMRFGLSERPVSGDIVLVDIDARSLDKLGVWPLPRRLYADLVDRLTASGAQEIVFDVDFSARSTDEDDRLFAEAIRNAGNVSLAMFSQAASAQGSSDEVVNRPIDPFLDNAWPVVVMVPVESDSRVWRNIYGFEIEGVSELSVASLLSGYSGEPAGAFGLDYSIAIDTLPRISLVDVLEGAAPTERFSGKKVIIGASALELRDLFPVPAHEILPGSVIQALGAETLLQHRPLTTDGEMYAVLAALAILFVLMMSGIEGWKTKVAILALTAVVFELTAFVVQKNVPVLVPTTCAHFALVFGAAAIVLRELGFHKFLSHLAMLNRRNSERMLGLVFDDSFDAILVVNDEGRITAASQVARAMFDCPDPVGKLAKEILPAELATEAGSVLGSSPGQEGVPKLLVMQQDLGKRRYIEYVVTRSEKAVLRKSFGHRVEKQAVACLTCRDVTDERESAAQLKYLARFDPITGLLNRNGLEEELVRQTAVARAGERELCLLQFAVANLDQIIASLGFSYGDEIRQAIAARLKSHLSSDVTWSSITADIFAAVFVSQPGSERLDRLLVSIEEIVGEDYSINGARISVQLKFGYVDSAGGMSPDDLLKKSGNALAKVRRDTRSSCLAFRPEMDDALQRRRSLETELFKAIARDELQMAYQPLVDLRDGSVFGAEALLRWDNRQMGRISPAEFVPIAEESGYIVELGAWVLNRAMKEALTWSEPLRLSVNVSAVQLSRGNFVSMVVEALERTRFPAGRLDLEITETLFIDENIDLRFYMEELKALGCSFSLDDFGTGYSSLGYIPKYPFSKIKLDRSFVRENLSRKQDVAVIESVLHLASGNGMSVVVEGIETQEQAERLSELGCEFGQGYLFGRPMDAASIASLLRKAA